MRQVDTRAEVRATLQESRLAGARVALVPTMGFLHEGHLSLIDRARERADCVVVSIFVNPLQFGPTEDLERYPRSIERDFELASARGADLLFTPNVTEMYPDGEPRVSVAPGLEAERLCGATRAGHFRGVLTVVAKLFGIVQPDAAVFGQKDFQQAVLIRRMVRDLDMQIDVDIAPTVREPDGLALSSRNVYLFAAERTRARALFAGLTRCQALFSSGETDAEVLRATLLHLLAVPGVEAEYAEVVDADTFAPVRRVIPGTVCAVAARVGTTRLIDNLVLV